MSFPNIEFNKKIPHSMFNFPTSVILLLEQSSRKTVLVEDSDPHVSNHSSIVQVAVLILI